MKSAGSQQAYNRSKKGDFMAESLRITVNDLKERMEAGQDFTIIDTRNPQAWGESEEKLPEAVRMAADAPDAELKQIPSQKPIVAYCT